MKSERRTTGLDIDRLRQMKDRRTKDDLLGSIPKLVGADSSPSRLSREAVVESIVALEDVSNARWIAETMNERNLRRWLSDLCDFEYDPGAKRGISYRRDELRRIARTLEKHLDGGVQG